MVEFCENNCDDQRTLNTSYKNVADIQWKNVNETSQQVDYPDFSLGYHKVGSGGLKRKHVDALQVLVLGTKDITRGGTAEDCDDAWIIHPHSGKSARAKINTFKMFEDCLGFDVDSIFSSRTNF